MEFENLTDFFQHMMEFDAAIYLSNGVCLIGSIEKFSVPECIEDDKVPYVIIKPNSSYENDPFPYQFINLNNIGSIQRAKSKPYND
jgi:sialic acid synthase SpsE